MRRIFLSFSHVQATGADEEGAYKERFDNDNDHNLAKSPALRSARRSRYRLHHRALQSRFREDARQRRQLQLRVRGVTCEPGSG